MFKKLIITFICFALPFSVGADVLKLKEGAPKSYVVKKGDTLWDISARFLNQPWLWPKLWRMNPDIKNPHLIYPGDKLSIIYDPNGEPMLVKGKPSIKWSPSMRSQIKQKDAVTTVPLAKLAPYLTYEKVMSQTVLDGLPYVIGSEENHKSSMDNIKLYVNADLDLGQSYAVYKQGEALLDPVTREVLAYEAELLGVAKAVKRGDMSQRIPSTIYVTNVKREIRAGAKVVPIDDKDLMPSFFTMKPAQSGVNGRIIKATHDGREFGKFDVVMINRGIENDVTVGDILAINRKSPAVVETGEGPKYKEDASRLSRLTDELDDSGSYRMPEENIGYMMVFKTYEKVSMALIMSSSKSVKNKDLFAAPQ